MRDRTPQLVTVLGPAGIGKSRLVRELYQHADRLADVDVVPGAPAGARRSARTSPTPRWPTSSSAEAGHAGHRHRPRRPATGSTPRCATWCRPARRPGSPTRCARWSACPARRCPPRTPSRPGGGSCSPWPPAGRPCWSSRTCTGPTTRCCASSSCSARSVRDVPLLVLCTARPELIDRDPGWAAHDPRLADDLADRRCATPAIADALRADVRPGHACRPTCCARWSSWPTASRSTPTSTCGCWSSGARCGRPSSGWVAGGQRRPADAGQRARGHRQPDRPARRRRTGRCCRRPPWSGSSSGRARSPPRWAPAVGAGRAGAARAGRSATSCASSRDSSDGRRARSTASGTCWSATSATSGCRAPSGSPGTSAPPTGSTRSPTAAAPTWPRCWPTTGGRRTRSPAPSALDAEPVRGGRPWPRCAGPPGGRTRCNAFDAAAAHVDRARGAAATARRRRRPTGSASSCSASSSPSTGTRPPSCAGAGPDRLTELADPALPGRRPRRRRPGVDAARPDRLAAGRPGRRAALPGPGGRAVRQLPDTPEKADAYAELGRLHMLNYEHAPALGADPDRRRDRRTAGPGRAAGQRAHHARACAATSPASATAWPTCRRRWSSAGSTSCRACAGPARTWRTPCGRRATRRRSEDRSGGAAPTRRRAARPERGTRSTPCRRCFAGDWDGFFAVADSVLDAADGRVGPAAARRAGLDAGAARRPDRRRRATPSQALAAARVERVLAPAMDGAGPRRALRGAARPRRRRGVAAGRAGRGLAADAHASPAASGSARPAHAAARLGPEAAELLARRARRRTAPHRLVARARSRRSTARWPPAGGDYTGAAMSYLDAADRYARRGQRDRPDPGPGRRGRGSLLHRGRRASTVGSRVRRPPAPPRPRPRWRSSPAATASSRLPLNRPPRRPGSTSGGELGGGRGGGGRPWPPVSLAGLDLLGVDVDVLAAGELHQLVHDLVGDRPLDEPVAGHPGVPGEVQRRAEPDPGTLDLRDDLARAAGSRRR